MWKSIILGALVACMPILGTAAEEEGAASEQQVIQTKHKKTSKKKRRHVTSGFQQVSLPVSSRPEQLNLRSNSVLIYDLSTGESVYTKNVDAVQPIASITKLMTALVVMESNLDLNEAVTIDAKDVDTLRNTRSRLKVGTVIRRGDLMRLALMSSENRAAAALARSAPGGTEAFVAKMNEQAKILGLTQTHFADSSGLSSQNVSSPGDLAKLVQAAYLQPLIREYSTTPGMMLTIPDSGRSMIFNNTNRLVKSSSWHIGVQKTGFINESGQCLVMQASIAARPFVIVLLDAVGKYSRIADAIRVKKWLELRMASAQPAGST